ncbi:cation diffusion facilitator family transporter [Hippea jasoniae]|uniref:cation diffusion facilitator family transporter n=1 Tax=Hippea jasoniae TaxID=944479 RepID=UPI00054FF29E|nr:cation diffusion facilitator family transporter [Hippea jasoniae]
MKQNSSKSVVIVAFSANLLIALSKFGVFLFSGSSSMFSEAIHSTTDTLNQILLLIGIRQAKKKADKLHPFGYGKERFFWAFIVAIFLFLSGGLYSFVVGIKKIEHPHGTENLPVALALLVVSMVLEGVSFLRAKKQIDSLKDSLSVFEFMKMTCRVELIVVFFEDLAALVGLSIAFVFILLSYLTDNPIFDGTGSVIIGILLMLIALIVAKEMKSLIIGEAIPGSMKSFIIDAVKSQKNVRGIRNLKSMVLDEESILVAMEIVFSSSIAARDVRDTIDSIEKVITAKYPQIKNIYIEPTVE